MTCDDCGHSISANEIREKPLQSATDMLKHMAAHNASRAFATAERIIGAEPTPAVASGVSSSASEAECPAQSDQTRVPVSLAPTEITRLDDSPDMPTKQIPIM
jgi:hypothetical protein